MILYAKLMDAIAKENRKSVENLVPELWEFPRHHLYTWDFLQVCEGSFNSFLNLRYHLLPDWIYRAEESGDGTVHVLLAPKGRPGWRGGSRIDTPLMFGGHEKCAAKAGTIALLKALEHLNKETS